MHIDSLILRSILNVQRGNRGLLDCISTHARRELTSYVQRGSM